MKKLAILGIAIACMLGCAEYERDLDRDILAPVDEVITIAEKDPDKTEQVAARTHEKAAAAEPKIAERVSDAQSRIVSEPEKAAAERADETRQKSSRVKVYTLILALILAVVFAVVVTALKKDTPE